MKRKHRLPFTLLAVLFCALMLTLPAQASKRQNTWVTAKSQKVYYYGSKGKKVTGLKEINGKFYYFDKSGVQRTGWQKIKNNYYFFNIAAKKKGYMVTSKTVNNICLDKNGKAKQTPESLRKLKILVTANQIVEKITNPKMTKEQKLKKCFDYTIQTYGYQTWRTFSNTSGWELSYAEDMFFRGRGNCFSYASAFAFLANAVGYKNVYVISSGGHGWAEIGGKVYDPDWTFVSKVDSYFAMSYDLSGVNGRPNYKPNRAFIAKL